MKKRFFLTLLLFSIHSFCLQNAKAQYNFPIENRPEIYHHIGFNGNEAYLINEHLYIFANRGTNNYLLTVFDVGYPKSINVLKKLEVIEYKGAAVCSIATLLGDTVGINNFLSEECYGSSQIFERKKPLFHITARENIVEFRDEGKVISSLELPDKIISPTKNLKKIILNNRYVAVFYDNLYLVDVYDICEPKIVGKYSFDEIEATKKGFNFRSVMRICDKKTLFINTKEHYFWIDISDVEKPILKVKYACEKKHRPMDIVEDMNNNTILINGMYESGGYVEQRLIMLKQDKVDKKWKESIIHEFGSHIMIVNDIGKTKNDKYLYFHDFNALYIFNKQTAIIENVIYKTPQLRTNFVVLEDIVAVCGREAFNGKISLLQNNGDASLSFVVNMYDELRKKNTNCGLIAIKDNLMCIGGVAWTERHGLTIFNIDDLTSPKYLFDGSKQKEFLPYRSYLTLSFYKDQLVTSTMDYSEGIFWTIYNLENPEMPKEMSRKKQKIQRPYRHFRAEEEDIYYAIKYENSSETKVIELYVAYHSLQENEVEVKEFTYRLSEENHGLTAYEKEIMKKLQLILTIDKETQRVRYKYGRGKYSLKNGFLYKLTNSAGIEVYKM